MAEGKTEGDVHKYSIILTKHGKIVNIEYSGERNLSCVQGTVAVGPVTKNDYMARAIVNRNRGLIEGNNIQKLEITVEEKETLD